MKLSGIKRFLPDRVSTTLALVSALLLIVAFPDFEYWWAAWFAALPLIWAARRDKDSPPRAFVAGWLCGVVFFFGAFWWLTFAPINYAGFPPAAAYFLLLMVSMAVAVFPAVFSAMLAAAVRRFGDNALLAAPFVWVFTEFLRYWLTGNNWNAIGYSQAFARWPVSYASIGGIYLVGFVLVLNSAMLARLAAEFIHKRDVVRSDGRRAALAGMAVTIAVISASGFLEGREDSSSETRDVAARVIAIQPNVPMNGLTAERWQALRARHAELAEDAIQKSDSSNNGIRPPTIVIFPESPMNFAYEEDAEFRRFLSDFASRNNVSVLFNSAEPNPLDGRYFNSAVMVDNRGREVAQYDKIFLLPFGESVPDFLSGIVPAFVGNFSPGTEQDILPLADAKSGVMICFESHFGQLSRDYVRKGADVLIEMTNDGYLGKTPVLRQHLANAIFRSVETNRPLLRVTNVGVTAFIDEYGRIMDTAESYTQDVRTWEVRKSDGGQTIYVRFGDWFAWTSSFFAVTIFIFGIRRLRSELSATSY